MKRKTICFDIAKIVATCAMIAMLFIKFIHDRAVLPTEDGGTTYVDHYYSIYDKFAREGLRVVVWLVLIALVFSIALHVSDIVHNGKLSRQSIIVFLLNIFFLLVLLFVAATVFVYNY